ncbi:MAG: SelL-related redox protein [Saprospiraceae bacterium]
MTLAEDFDLDVMYTNRSEPLGLITEKQPVLLVFLRHFGCTFCREAIAELAKNKKKIESKGVRIIFVHMAEENIAESFFKEYKFPNAEHISDQMCTYYKEFGLVKGTMNQLFGLKNWARTIESGLIKGHLWGREIGDGFQMPGVFVLNNRKVISSYIHKYVSDHPDYISMADECCVR